MQDNVAKFFSDVRAETIDMNPNEIQSDTNNTFTPFPFDKENLVMIMIN